MNRRLLALAIAASSGILVFAQGNPSTKLGAGSATPLLTAIYHEDVQAVDRLVAAGADVRAANREGVTPLAMACLDGNLPIIDRLLKAGADAKERGPNGETLLMFAASSRLTTSTREELRGTTALM